MCTIFVQLTRCVGNCAIGWSMYVCVAVVPSIERPVPDVNYYCYYYTAIAALLTVLVPTPVDLCRPTLTVGGLLI